jgi:hypothetical protein
VRGAAGGIDGLPSVVLRKRRSRRLLLTTNTELNAIAAPAIIGLSSQAAASGEPGGLLTERPKHDFTCTNPDELVAFDADFRTAAEPGAGVQAVLDRHGKVLRVEETRGAAIPPAAPSWKESALAPSGCARTSSQAASCAWTSR